MLALRPDASDVPRDRNPLAGEGVSTVTGRVTAVDPSDCGSGGTGPDDIPPSTVTAPRSS